MRTIFSSDYVCRLYLAQFQFFFFSLFVYICIPGWLPLFIHGIKLHIYFSNEKYFTRGKSFARIKSIEKLSWQIRKASFSFYVLLFVFGKATIYFLVMTGGETSVEYDNKKD